MTIFDVYSGSHGSAGSPLRFPEAKADGVRGIVVKSTQGVGYVNPFAEGDLADAQAAGIATATYHYAGNPDGSFGTPAQEAEFAKANGHGRFVWLDLEQLKNETFAQTGAWAQAFFDAIGAAAGLYSDRSYLSNLPGAPWGRPLWIADPGDVDRPAEAVMVQTGTKAVSWAPALLDVDEWVGTEEQFHACFTAATAGPVPSAPAKEPAPAPRPVTDSPGRPPAPVPPPPLPVLKLGAAGGAVTSVQALLKAKGQPAVQLDGLYGGATMGAVIDYQRFLKLEVDGIVGPQTWGALLLLPLE